MVVSGQGNSDQVSFRALREILSQGSTGSTLPDFFLYSG
jgi:hypothetical protein